MAIKNHSSEVNQWPYDNTHTSRSHDHLSTELILSTIICSLCTIKLLAFCGQVFYLNPLWDFYPLRTVVIWFIDLLLSNSIPFDIVWRQVFYPSLLGLHSICLPGRDFYETSTSSGYRIGSGHVPYPPLWVLLKHDCHNDGIISLDLSSLLHMLENVYFNFIP